MLEILLRITGTFCIVRCPTCTNTTKGRSVAITLECLQLDFTPDEREIMRDCVNNDDLAVIPAMVIVRSLRRVYPHLSPDNAISAEHAYRKIYAALKALYQIEC